MDSAQQEDDMDFADTEIDQYEYIRTLGSGAYGKVVACKHVDTGKIYAHKTMTFTNLAENGIPSNAIREVSLLKELDHPNIIKVHEVLYYRPTLHMFMEYMKTDLKKYIEANKPLSNSKIQTIMKNILSGVKEMHSNRAIHRDLKPENIFMSENDEVKIGDFGISRTFGVSSKPMSNEVVTIFYRAPEIALKIKEYSIAIDVWSWGCIFAEMYLGYPLFQVENEIDLINTIFKTLGTPTDETWEGITRMLSIVMPRYPITKLNIEGMDEIASDLLNLMLTLNPCDRISAKEALQHAYFSVEYD